MEFTTLGRTGLRVSRMGLGCGGHSRLGLGSGGTEENAVAVVREALALGVNFIDTAEGYRTEEVVGRGIADATRGDVVISTKAGIGWQERRSTPQEMRERVHACLRRLGTEYIDIFHLHGVRVEDYAYGRDQLVPELLRLKEEGKIRFVGITEAFGPDPTHRMLAPAVKDDCWDVAMVGFNILNQSARERVLATTLPKQIGTLCMFAVRRALSRPDTLRQLVREMAEAGTVDGAQFDLDDPLGFLTESGVASGVTEASYRFCRWEPGIDVVLSGTGNVEHLRQNATWINAGPLPSEVVDRLRLLFAGVDSVSGN
jgi:aryl-alcohol dehydrogenase-like predicted oxidoreductase